jgi:hypothetical protein
MGRKRSSDDVEPNPDHGDLQELTARLAWLAERLGAAIAETPVAPSGPADPPQAGGRLASLALAFSLDAVDVDLIVVAASPDLDARFETLYRHRHEGSRRPTVGTAFDVLGLSTLDHSARARLDVRSALVRHGLVRLGDPEVPFLGRPLQADERVVAHLLGDDRVDARVSPLLVPTVAVELPEATNLAAAIAAGMWVSWIRERPGTSGYALGAAACASLGIPAITVDLARLAPGSGLADVLTDAAREAALRGSALIVGPTDPSRDRAALTSLEAPPCPVLLVGDRTWDVRWCPVPVYLADAVPVPLPVRSEVWTSVLDDIGLKADDQLLDELAGFRLHPDQIVAAASMTAAQAVGDDLVTRDHLGVGLRAQSAGDIEALASRLVPRARFEDLVVADETLQELRGIVTRVRTFDLVRRRWGLGGARQSGLGVTALFAGPSGTGKSLGAEVLAGELGVELYTIDLSQVVDKFIGETEKNLDRIFAAAQRVNGVLLFDEADALFGKRTSVSDAHDRHANVEVAYLLQRMESFDGVAVLATNLAANLDDAFQRRIDVICPFDPPDEEQRRHLWRLHIPAELPRTDDVDLDWLATSMETTGGVIRNACLQAAHVAAGEDRPVCMADLVLATVREQRKLSRVVSAEALGEFAHLLD